MTSNTLLNKSSEREHPCLAPDLRGKASSFLPLRILFMDLSYMIFITLRYSPSVPSLLRVFIMKWILNFFRCFYCIYWRRQWHPTPVLLPGKSHGRRSLVGCSPWGREESDTTEQLHFHFSLSCIGEGNGNPLQCSCLENPRDRGAWWATVYGVTQSRTRLKRLSSSSSTVSIEMIVWFLFFILLMCCITLIGLHKPSLHP